MPLLGHLAAGKAAQSQGFVCIVMNSFSCLSLFFPELSALLIPGPPKTPTVGSLLSTHLPPSP